MTLQPGTPSAEDIAAEMNEHPKITPDLIRAMLRGHFVVVKPGETLIIRPDPDWTPFQIREYQDFLDGWHFTDAPDRLPFRAVALPGEEFVVAKAEAE